MKSCPFCFQSDLNDRATKCPHCGAWLDGDERENREFDELRRELQKELREDRQDYQDYMKSIFNRVQFAASIILALVIGTSAWFGFRTDKSIVEIKQEIISRIETDVKAEVQTAKTQKLIAEGIDDAVTKITPEIERQANEAAEDARSRVSSLAEEALGQLNNHIENAQNGIEATVRRAQAGMAGTLDEIAKLDKALGPARKRLASIERKAQSTIDAIVNAAQASVEKLALPVDPVGVEEKRGIDKIPALIEQRAKALGFNLDHGGYYGPAIWMYLDNLIRLPEFRFVVITSNRGLFGVIDASLLVSIFNPPNAKELTERYPLRSNSLPDVQEVPGWSAFAELLNSGDDTAKEKLASLAGFIPGTEAVPIGWSKRQCLQRMEAKDIDWLPVVDEPGGRFIGIMDRSRLTSSLLLEIARGVEAPQ